MQKTSTYGRGFYGNPVLSWLSLASARARLYVLEVFTLESSARLHEARQVFYKCWCNTSTLVNHTANSVLECSTASGSVSLITSMRGRIHLSNATKNNCFDDLTSFSEHKFINSSFKTTIVIIFMLFECKKAD